LRIDRVFREKNSAGLHPAERCARTRALADSLARRLADTAKTR
jgi:hypothetical protein